jgi:hypothetical protein
MMAFEYHVEIWVNGAWTDITSYVFGHDRAEIVIDQGSSSESGSAQPCRVDMEINNRDGRFSPLNATGPYYGSLGLNTPLRIYKQLISAGFATVVSSAWPDTDTPVMSWTTFEAGGVIAASDYSSSSGRGNHSVPAANAYRSTYLAGTDYQECDVTVDLKLDTTNITGEQVSWAVLLGGETTSDYYSLAVELQTDETFFLSLLKNGVTYIDFENITDSGLVHTTAQVLRLRVQLEGWHIRAKLWASTGSEPAEWMFDARTTEDVPFGWIGLQSKRWTGNTNGTLVFSYDNLDVKLYLFAGEVAEWPNQRDETGNDVYSPITAAGLMRRVGAANKPIQSPIRGFVNTQPIPATSVVGYWALEERSKARSGSPDIGTGPAVIVDTQATPTAHDQQWGNGSVPAWLYPTFAFYGDGWLQAPVSIPGFTAIRGWRWEFAVKPASSGDWAVTLQCQTYNWVLTFKPATKVVTVRKPDLSTLDVDFTSTVLFDGGMHILEFGVHQDGADIDFQIATDEGAGATLGSIAGTVEPLWLWYVSGSTHVDSPSTIGHVVVWDADFTFGGTVETWDALAGLPGETAIDRMDRLCALESVPFYSSGDAAVSAALGPQSLSALSGQLDSIAETDGGILFDTRSTLGMMYRGLSNIVNQSPTVTLDYAAGELVAPLDPQFDDRNIINRVRASSESGGEYEVIQTTGPMSTLPPAEGGAGEYFGTVQVNTYLDDQLPHVAGWRVRQGTLHEMRYPSVSVNLVRAALSAAKVNRLLQTRVGDRIDLDNLPDDHGAGTAVRGQLVRGFQTRINRFSQSMTFYTVPASGYEVAEADDGVSKAGAAASYLASSPTSGATSFTVKSLDGTRWTTDAGQMPLLVTIGGEDMSVGAVSDSVPAFVAAGAAAHADNASVTPTLPAGGTTTGDALLVLAVIRNTAATVNLPTDYMLLGDFGGHYKLFGKIHDGSEAAPTVTFAGGAAGDTTSAVMCSIRNMPLSPTAGAGQANGSAQNIAVPAISDEVVLVDSIAIATGWKQDDWTSVLPPDHFTEIGEPSTTTGGDQGLTWAYRILRGNNYVDPVQFTVTGGGAAISKGTVQVYGNWQTFSSVTRSVNGVVKAHTAGETELARVRLTRPAIAAVN